VYVDQENCYNNYAFHAFFKKYKEFEYVEGKDNIPEKMG
jgi:hypothetical protein